MEIRMDEKTNTNRQHKKQDLCSVKVKKGENNNGHFAGDSSGGSNMQEPSTERSKGKSVNKTASVCPKGLKEVKKNSQKNQRPKKQYKCPFCGKMLSSKLACDVHVKKLHIEDKSYPCEVCSKKFTEKNSLKLHMTLHNGNRPFVCKICNHNFGKSSHLVQHMQIHSGLRPFKCDICPKDYYKKSHLNQHIKLHMGDTGCGCEICNKRFRTKGNLKTHMDLHHSMETTSKRVEFISSCIGCDMTFNHSTKLNQHLGFNPKCRKIMKNDTEKAILKHKDGRYQCEFCKTIFDEQIEFKKHREQEMMKRTHSCHLCLARFDHKTGLRYHKSMHSTQKLFPCSFCEKIFKNEPYLKQHQKSHNRLFQCELCVKNYGLKPSLLRHYRIVHKKNYSNSELQGKFTKN